MALTLSLATSVTSETVPAILFAVRLAVRVESAAAVLMDHAEGRVARAWPRLTVTPHVLEDRYSASADKRNSSLYSA